MYSVHVTDIAEAEILATVKNYMMFYIVDENEKKVDVIRFLCEESRPWFRDLVLKGWSGSIKPSINRRGCEAGRSLWPCCLGK
jgi:hypothetical protein